MILLNCEILITPSKDLSKLNNIQTNINNKEYKGGSEKYNESWSVKYPTYNKELKFKFNTIKLHWILIVFFSFFFLYSSRGRTATN